MICLSSVELIQDGQDPVSPMLWRKLWQVVADRIGHGLVDFDWLGCPGLNFGGAGRVVGGK